MTSLLSADAVAIDIGVNVLVKRPVDFAAGPTTTGGARAVVIFLIDGSRFLE